MKHRMTARAALKLIVLLLTTATAYAQPAVRPASGGPIPDPAQPSGWLWVELAVLVDPRTEILESEFWPPFPEARYPEAYRWLLDADRLNAVDASHPHADTRQDEHGRITVEIPDPERILAEAIAAEEAAALDAAQEAGPADTPPPEQAETTDAPEPIPLELIDVEPHGTRASVDWLDDFDLEQLTQTPDPQDSADMALTGPDETISMLEPEPPPPSLPTPFLRRPVTMLAPGLTALETDTENRLELKVAWAQPAQADNLPILLDYSGDSEVWPPLQGFVQLRTRDELRLGVNLWWNTDGAYYPPEFSMPAPPTAPSQIDVIDPEEGRLLSKSEIEARQQALREIDAQKQAGDFPTIFIDPDTGLRVGDPVDENTEVLEHGFNRVLEQSFPWPWRHYIHVADTRPVPPGSVRYFDHPVLKVVATYREMTWGEVHALGDEDRKRREFDAALKAASDHRGPEATAGPRASTVPPDRQPRQ